ncbi:MAG: type II toxin-antitoxin system VapC family toxin [Methanoregula sp.]|nr:type II toxin-antitoxin system VapC family toxin [Methanoregula sp.]
MHGDAVLDSSIIAAIFFPEKITEKAGTVAENYDCITVDLAYAEVANVAWKITVRSPQKRDVIQSLLADSCAFIRETCRVIPAQDLVPEAYDLACSRKITIYDALFLSAAVRENALLVTADTKLHFAAREIAETELVC